MHQRGSAATDEREPAAVLVIGDHSPQRQVLEHYLHDLGCRIQTADEANLAIQLLAADPPDLIVLDLSDSEARGYELIQQVKRNTKLAHTPILVASIESNAQDRAKALELGADDFTVKGFDESEFKARARHLLGLKRSTDRLGSRCERALRQAMTDSLTGLFTHGFIQELLRRDVSSARRHGEELSLIFADIDHFKHINDRHGHAWGDQVLKAIARRLHESVRDGDIVARHGCDEFVVLLRHTDATGARILADRIRAAVESLAIPVPYGGKWDCTRATLSLGIASFPQDAADAESLLDRADGAMYAAKQAGRNSVVQFSQIEIEPGQARVLIVDDTETDLKHLEQFLVPHGYQTLRASDGQEGVQIARRAQPDLILLDGVMPYPDGFDVCQRLKQESETCLIPVVMVTGSKKREDRLRGIVAGADDFLTKPVNSEELLARVRTLIRSKRHTDLLQDTESVIFTLARAIEGRDASTGGHVERVSRFAVELGQALGLSAAQIEGLRRAGYVHDIGKIVVPDALLLNPGKLSPGERKIMERHVEAGYELLRPLGAFGESLPAVRFHHERLDGSGYPLGLRGDEIPIVAQVLAVVDVYDALTTDRAYRAALSQDEAGSILRDEATRGLHKPELVETFLQLVAQRSKSDSHEFDAHAANADTLALRAHAVTESEGSSRC